MGRWFRWAELHTGNNYSRKKKSSILRGDALLLDDKGERETDPPTSRSDFSDFSCRVWAHVSIPEAPGHTAVLCTLNITPQPPITAPRTTFQQLHSRCRSRHESRLEWFVQKMRKCFSFGKKSYFSTNVWQHLNHRNATLSLPDKNSAFLCLYLLSLTPNGGRHEQNLISQYE